MRIALVTETFPPEVNGVAMTLGRLVAGLREGGDVVDVVRPRQHGESPQTPPPPGEWVVPGMPIPFYRSLRMGLPVVRSLRKRWRIERPDVPLASVRSIEPDPSRETGHDLGDLDAVLPVAHSFGRRGR